MNAGCSDTKAVCEAATLLRQVQLHSKLQISVYILKLEITLHSEHINLRILQDPDSEIYVGLWLFVTLPVERLNSGRQ